MGRIFARTTGALRRTLKVTGAQEALPNGYYTKRPRTAFGGCEYATADQPGRRRRLLLKPTVTVSRFVKRLSFSLPHEEPGPGV